MIWIIALAYAVNLIMHYMIAELSYNNDGAQFIACFEKELFTGKFKKIATWIAFGLLALSVLVNVAGFIAGAAAVFSSWFGMPRIAGMLLYYILAALVVNFGMKLVGLETPTYDADAQVDVEYLNGIHKDFVVDVANMQPFEQVNLVKKLKPDVFIGVPEWAAKLGIPTTHVLDMKRPTMGYDGLIFLGNKIADQLSNPGFNVKLSKHVRLPYKDSWYNEDAFKYIVGGEENV
jgi:hypothetical protein